MLRPSLPLFALLFLACASAAGAAPKPAKAPTPAAAPSRKALPDPRDPESLIGVLSGLGAKAEVSRREADAVFLAVTSPTENFSVQFAGCNAQGKLCQALLFDHPAATSAPTLAQLNGFNQTSVMCRVYQDRGGRPHVEYSTLLFPNDSRPVVLMQLNAWRGCLGDFNAFLKDPVGFLANAP